jgi:hypothetical protein
MRGQAMILSTALRRPRRWMVRGGCTAILASAAPIPTSGVAQARTIDGKDTAHMRLVHQNEMTLFEEGRAKGALPGQMRATLIVGSIFRGSCTIYTSRGSITGHGAARPHGTGRYQSFSGSLDITGGSGVYRHAHGRTGLYGTFDRRTFALVVQTTGRISY